MASVLGCYRCTIESIVVLMITGHKNVPRPYKPVYNGTIWGEAIKKLGFTPKA